MREKPQTEHGRHVYDPADFGWSYDSLAEVWEEYTERYAIERFLAMAAPRVDPGARLLDAGAGMAAHRRYFPHVAYESTDVVRGLADKGGRHAYVSELDRLPVRPGSYDAIICTQVLEHVEYPQRVIGEFHRALKPGGQLFLTAPQAWGVHMAPFHFYNFTRFGLESLFRNARFDILSIEPLGGIFWNLAKIVSKLPRYILEGRRRSPVALLFLYPAYLLYKPLCELAIPLACFFLDRLDTRRDWTIGYSCHCRKGVDAGS